MSRLQQIDTAVHRWLVANSIQVLRISLGIVFLAFGLLKYFPGVSPAEGLSEKTTDALSFGLAPAHIAIVFVATLESVIGVLLISGRFLRVAVYLLLVNLVGILAPLLLFSGRLFGGPHGAPTLEGQYVVKDIILAAAGFVVASTLPGLVPGADARHTRSQRGSVKRPEEQPSRREQQRASVSG